MPHAFENRENYRDGARLGIRWAQHLATLTEIECIEIFRDHLQAAGHWPSWFTPDPANPGPVADRWYFAVIDPHGANIPNRIPFRLNRARTRRFWQTTGATVEQLGSPEFIHGFTEGALAVWHQFKTPRNNSRLPGNRETL